MKNEFCMLYSMGDIAPYRNGDACELRERSSTVASLVRRLSHEPSGCGQTREGMDDGHRHAAIHADRRPAAAAIYIAVAACDLAPIATGGIFMIGYVTVGTNELPRAAAFYDALFGTIGASRYMESDRFIAWTVSPTTPAFGVALPFDGKPATVGNGGMIALLMDGRARVDALHAKALELGASDEGAPGPRGDGFYAGYFRDLDGNKLNAFCFG
jgi:catechol 2,3-dioxygenase-like lactoylglutathione lyase family enzyme